MPLQEFQSAINPASLVAVPRPESWHPKCFRRRDFSPKALPERTRYVEARNPQRTNGNTEQQTEPTGACHEQQHNESQQSYEQHHG